MKIRRRFIITLLSIGMFSISIAKDAEKEPCNLIVFIHGSIQPAEWRWSDVVHVLRNKVEHSLYSKTSYFIRKDPFFYRGQAMQKEGLQPIFLNKNTAVSAIVQMCELQYQWQHDTTPRLYYTFGWDGIIHRYNRYKASHDLMYALCDELHRLRAQGKDPTITLIAYSHGGNVALNLAVIKDDDPTLFFEPFVVENLVMFATPIQKATDYLIASPLFKNIYHFYSVQDRIQTLDFTSPRQFFSYRIFKKRRDFELPDTLTQVQMRVTSKLIGSKKWKNNDQLDSALSSYKLRCKHCDPRHSEFWNFDWSSSRYRSEFPLTPLPLVVLFPTFIQVIKDADLQGRMLIFDYVPEYNRVILKHKRKKEVMSFLSNDHMQQLYDIAQKINHTDFDWSEHKEHLKRAIDNAKSKKY